MSSIGDTFEFYCFGTEDYGGGVNKVGGDGYGVEEEGRGELGRVKEGF